MPIPYTEHDRRIADAVLFKFRFAHPEDPGIGGEGGSMIKFQFPPKILSDNRKGTWDEGDLRGVEPLAVFSTSGPREFALQWTYIVEGVNGVGGGWTIEQITENVNRVRGYFANLLPANGRTSSLIVDFKFPAITGEEPWTCRIKGIDVKHSDNLIGDPEFCYPLRTDIVVDMRLWTKVTKGTEGADSEGAEEVTNLPLKPNPTFTDYWY